MKKKILALAVLSAFLLGSCGAPAQNTAGTTGTEASRSTAEESGQGDTEQSDSEEDAPVSEKYLAADIVNYIYYCETIYGNIGWAIDSIEKFDSERTWNELLKARAAVAILSVGIDGCDLPSSILTDEYRTELASNGFDLSYTDELSEEFSAGKELALNNCNYLNDGLMSFVYTNMDWMCFMDCTSMMRKFVDAELEYLANIADSVVVKTDRAYFIEQFNEMMNKYCPLTQALRKSNPPSEEWYKTNMDDLVNRICSYNLDTAKMLGAQKTIIADRNEAVSGGDVSEYQSDLLGIENAPGKLRRPEWFACDDPYYFWTKDGEIQDSPLPGTELTNPPDGYQLSISDITLEQVTAYRDELVEAGAECLAESEEDGMTMYVCILGSSSFVLSWKDNTAVLFVVSGDLDFVPAYCIG